jgi:hypothetical protein
MINPHPATYTHPAKLFSFYILLLLRVPSSAYCLRYFVSCTFIFPAISFHIEGVVCRVCVCTVFRKAATVVVARLFIDRYENVSNANVEYTGASAGAGTNTTTQTPTQFMCV